MSVPTVAEEYAKLAEYLRKAQESAAMIAHIMNAEHKQGMAQGWIIISENMKTTLAIVTKMAAGRLN